MANFHAQAVEQHRCHGGARRKSADCAGENREALIASAATIQRKCSSSIWQATIVSICVSRDAPVAGGAAVRRPDRAGFCAYLSMCIPAADIREHSAIRRCTRAGLCGAAWRAWSLLKRRRLWIRSRQPSRRTVRTVPFNAKWISRARAIASRSAAGCV